MDVIGSEVGSPGFEVRNLLREGEVVQILSAAEDLARGPRPTSMLRIRPPRGEFRFIRQRDIVPAEEYVALPADTGRSAVQPEIERKPVDSMGDQIRPLAGPEQNLLSGGLNTTQPVTAGSGPQAADVLPGGATFELARTAPRSTEPEQKQHLPQSATDGIAMTEFGFQAPGPADPVYAQLTDAEKKQVDAAWSELKSLDQSFRQMRQKPIAEWRLPELKQRYERLGQTPDSFVRRQIERRLAGMGRYERVYREFNEVQEILRQTEVRDEQIRQSYLSQRQTTSTGQPSRTLVRRTAPAASSGFPASRTTPQPTVNRYQARPEPARPAMVQPLRQQSRRFDGAGIIQRTRAVRGGVRHVLLAPDGRVLAYLQGTTGINLDRFVGQSMGLTGPRQYRRDLGADLLVVRQLTPVRLTPSRSENL
jgi:hypothetical protein